MNPGFVRATSENLPKLDLEMLLTHISSVDCYESIEMRGVKAKSSMRPSYGDEAIGYVQVQRKGQECTVLAKVCPEHKVRNKNYSVEILIDEQTETVVKAECQDCAASQGGCKHAIAVLAWVYRKSEQPPCTSVGCYWKKPVLSGVGSTIKYKEIREMLPKALNEDKASNSNKFLKSILDHPKAKNCESHIIQFFRPNTLQTLSLHYQAVYYKGDKDNVDDFKQYCSQFLTDDNCFLASRVTCQQADSSLWFELRYGRITASVIYEAAQCTTVDGSLVQRILGFQHFTSPTMQRGKSLESTVLSIVGQQLKVRFGESNIRKSGLIMIKDLPMLGASPDGLTDNAVIEIKCPINQDTVKNYYDAGTCTITNKYRVQLHLQMYFSGKMCGYFCIASPNFEKDKDVSIIKEALVINFITGVMKRAVKFWETSIFPHFMKI